MIPARSLRGKADIQDTGKKHIHSSTAICCGKGVDIVLYLKKNMMKTAGFVLISVLLIGALLRSSYPYLSAQVMAVMGQAELKPVYSVETDKKRVALSFDAAWGAEFTPTLLEILERYDLKTTFFLVGFWVDAYPEMVREIAAAGHEVQNHTTTHPHLSELSAEKIAEELNITGQKITALTGVKPNLFRPPFGEYDHRVLDVAAANGYQSIQWSIDSLDWMDLSADEILLRVVKEVEPGDIILFHNNGANTTQALPRIIDELLAKGFEIVPVGELIYRDNYVIDSVTGVMRSKAK